MMSTEKRKAEGPNTINTQAATEVPKVEKASETSEEKPEKAIFEAADQKLCAAAETVEAGKDAATSKACIKAEKAACNADPFETLAKRYAKAYPDCRAFHITTDRQVFLEKDKNLAQYHQKGLGGGEVRTIKVK